MISKIFYSILATLILLAQTSPVTAARHDNIDLANGSYSGATLICDLQNDLTPADIEVLINRIVKLVDERFVDIQAGKRVIAGIKKNQENGKYRKINTDREFISILNKDLYAFSNDLHLTVRPIDQAAQNTSGPQRVVRRQAPGAQVRRQSGTGPRIMGGRLRTRPAGGHFIGEILHGNIGYVKVNGVLAPLQGTKVKEDMETALTRVKNTDAVIFDLRNVPGGVPETMSLLSSYLYTDKPVHLNTYHHRLSGSSKLHTRPEDVPFHLGLERPLYVLINRGTASGGEAFTYVNQQHGRVTVIGEISRGAGRLSVPHSISETLYLMLPENRSEHPVSKTGFEQIGVIPDIKVKSENSLNRAHVLAIENLIKNHGEKSGWKSALIKISADKLKVNRRLGEYAGTYDERTVAVSNDGLLYKRAGQPEFPLKEISKDNYRIILPAGVRSRNPIPTFRFNRDDDGNVVSLSLIAKDGSVHGTYVKTP